MKKRDIHDLSKYVLDYINSHYKTKTDSLSYEHLRDTFTVFKGFNIRTFHEVLGRLLDDRKILSEVKEDVCYYRLAETRKK